MIENHLTQILIAVLIVTLAVGFSVVVKVMRGLCLRGLDRVDRLIEILMPKREFGRFGAGLCTKEPVPCKADCKQGQTPDGIAVCRPQVPFRIRRVVVPRAMFGHFLITNIQVGKNSQFPFPGPMPCEYFAVEGVGMEVRFDTVHVAQDVSIHVTNIGDKSMPFEAAIFGDYIDN